MENSNSQQPSGISPIPSLEFNFQELGAKVKDHPISQKIITFQEKNQPYIFSYRKK